MIQIQRSTFKYVSSAFIGLVLLTGCSLGALSATRSDKTTVTTRSAEKPPLVIPKSFDDENARISFANQALNDGYYADVKALMEESVAEQPRAAALALLGAARLNLEDYPGAIDAWSKAAEMDPRDAAEMRNNIGNALRNEKHLDAAKDAYRKALEMDPNLTTAAINLAYVLRTEGNLAEAVRVLEQSSARSQDNKALSTLATNWRQELDQKAHG